MFSDQYSSPEQLDETHQHVAQVKRSLASVLTAKGVPEEGEELVLQALEALRAAKTPGAWEIADAESVYGGCLSAQGRFSEAERFLTRSFEVLREARGEAAPYTRDAARRLIELYEAWGRPEEARPYRDAAGRRSAEDGG